MSELWVVSFVYGSSQYPWMATKVWRRVEGYPNLGHEPISASTNQVMNPTNNREVFFA